MEFSELTVVEIEKLENITYEPRDLEYSLPAWYDSIRTLQIREMNDGDIAIFLRQQLYLHYVVGDALARLLKNPMVGKKYEGEMFLALAERVPRDFWHSEPQYTQTAASLVNAITSGDLSGCYRHLNLEDQQEFLGAVNQLRRNLEL